MSSTEPAERDVPLAMRIAWLAARDYAVTMTGPVLVGSVLLRAVAQTTFLTLVGHYAGGAQGRQYAFMGAIAFAVVAPTVIKVTDVLTEERVHGTMHRLRLARTSILGVMILRSWVYVVEGLAAATTALILAGPVLVGSDQVRRLLLAIPMLTIIAVSCLGLGLCVATLAVDRRIVHLFANTAAYVVLLTSGAIVPAGRHLVLDSIGALLPMQHGLAAIRTGQPVFLLYELSVGAGWLVLAGLMLAVQSRRARKHGLDDRS